MKFLSILLIAAAGVLVGCDTPANNSTNANNANLRGANTNTGYVTNTDTNVRPTIPANATNITPGNMSSSNSANSNSNSNANRAPRNGQ